jgi:hypothetical protein
MGNFLNDALNLAKDALLGNAEGLLTGRNPLTQPQIGELFGFNIQGAPLVSTRDYFLLQLESWLTTIPLRSQWVILIQPFPSCINTEIMQGLERTGGDPKNFDINQAKGILASYPFQSVNGCLFAQSVTIPNESMMSSKTDAAIKNNRGFLPGVLSNGRQSGYGRDLTIDFLETNASFTDFVIRPWVIAGEHFGFVARENDSPYSRDFRNVKSTLYIMEYSRTFQNVSMIPKKIWTFFNCAPIGVESYKLDYNEPNTAPTISTTWTYTNYAVANSLYLPLPNIIDRISQAFRGKFPSISPWQKGGVPSTGNLVTDIVRFL